MEIKRIIVGVVFITLVIWFVTSFAQNNNICKDCEWQGMVMKCDDLPAYSEGFTNSGNCITIDPSYSTIDAKGNIINCVATTFYKCNISKTSISPGCLIQLSPGC